MLASLERTLYAKHYAMSLAWRAGCRCREAGLVRGKLMESDWDRWSRSRSFDGVVASDKNVVSSRVTAVTGRPPPLDLNFRSHIEGKVKDIPVSPCFAVMLAFSELLSSIPFTGLTFKNSKVLKWAHCENSKPGRSTSRSLLKLGRSIEFTFALKDFFFSERWVLHSSKEYAESIIEQIGLRKPSPELLARVAEDLLRELVDTGLDLPQPFFVKAHRWNMLIPLKQWTCGGSDSLSRVCC